jgi:signal transduction histidine kinase
VLDEHIDHWLEMDSYPGPLTQALQHLLENAVVHGFNGGKDGRSGTISVSAHDSSDPGLTGPGSGEITIVISDDGIGIPAANLPRIYDPFFTTRMGAGGSGLGLYITHNIVTGVLGGHIEVVSKVGHGTRFTLRLPKIWPSLHYCRLQWLVGNFRQGRHAIGSGRAWSIPRCSPAPTRRWDRAGKNFAVHLKTVVAKN